MNYGLKLKELRNEYNITQKEMADILGIKRSSYNQFEQQYDIIPINRLNQIANYFNVSIDYILNLNTIKSYDNNLKDLNNYIIKNRIKTLRKELKLTQIKMAEVLNTVQPVIANYENGKNLISTPFLYTLCKTYNISADYLLGKTNEPKYID